MSIEARSKPSSPALLQCKILVADDDPTNRFFIDQILKQCGFSDVRMATDGYEALEQLIVAPPDIFILDIVMPNLDGFALCARLRADERFTDLPILIQTGLDSASDRAEAFRCGATDLVTKPINPDELVARISLLLEKRLLIEMLSAYQRRTQEELLLAQEMQRDLLPSPEALSAIRLRYGIDVAGYVSPCSEIGGDLWGIGEIDATLIGFYALDFSGHGIGAALNTFRIQTLIGECWALADNPARFLGSLNDRLCRILSLGQFATMLYGTIDIQTMSLTFAAAGSPAPALTGARGETSCLLDGSGLPLGLSSDICYSNRHAALSSGSALFLASDAIIDSPDPRRRGFNPGEFLSLATRAAKERDAVAATAAIVAEFERGQVGPPIDDVTVMCLRF